MNEREILLDKLGPYMSGLGAFLGMVFIMVAYSNLARNFPYAGLLGYLFLFLAPYFMCTCMHNRKGMFYSSGSLGGLIGTIIGFCLFNTLGFALLGLLRGAPPGSTWPCGLTVLGFPAIFAFLGARFFCHRARDKPRKKKKYGRKIKVAIRHEKTQ
ncbi:MAG: hypothetical protein QXU48_00355 [Thermoplasmata archaeon]